MSGRFFNTGITLATVIRHRVKSLKADFPGALSFFFIACCCLPLPLKGQIKIPFRVMSWNVENLFDTRHDTLKNDREFLPHALRRWHYGRYRKKLTDVARTITAVGKWDPPALVALCEVENDTVLRDLTRRSPLRKSGYRYVMTQSPDARGIDVALLYQRDRFKLLASRAITVPPSKGYQPTRDILHVSGLVLTNDTLDLLIAHFPSRSGGVKESEPYRLQVARRLRKEADSILRARQHPQLIIMGDLNDYPTDKSIRLILDAQAPPLATDKTSGTLHSPLKLYHLLARKAKSRDFGSYKHQGKWGLLDHIIVSGRLLNSSADFHTSEEKADVARLPFLLIKDEKYGGKEPYRTYKGVKYQGGISDHLPVFADFELILRD
ncbi:endonuclease/exonuclease/phosphatase family protein [Bacteroides pyogenes F0041]|uniref:Endonuclease/exonuclease/phosphatase family protein n=2 Tax=Bacteroides pyogenes TaxID=310300 RepID=U2C6V2_9BACE|nr:endonuclease/exonuclease/phosphatase family protein [Bacteroides pyogenes F0041]